MSQTPRVSVRTAMDRLLRWAVAHPLHILAAGLFAVLAIDCATRPGRSGCRRVVAVADGGAR